MKRAYDPVSHNDGTRFLVERLWPRGVSKAKLRVDARLKEAGPTTELRKWFSHDPEKWDEFRRRYIRELRSHPEAWQPIVSAARRGRVSQEGRHDEPDVQDLIGLVSRAASSNDRLRHRITSFGFSSFCD